MGTRSHAGGPVARRYDEPERRVLSTLLLIGGCGMLFALVLLHGLAVVEPIDTVIFGLSAPALLGLGVATWTRSLRTEVVYRTLTVSLGVGLFLWQTVGLLQTPQGVDLALAPMSGVAPFVFVLAFLGWQAERAMLISGGFLAATLLLPVLLVSSGAIPTPGVRTFVDFFVRFGVGQSLMVGAVLLFARNRRQVADAAYRLSVLGQLARTDTLTGLLNRRGLLQQIGLEAERNTTQPCRLALVFIDLDHFKLVNDRWGHPVGDQVLMELADVLRRAVRTSDVVGRWGGEEFVVLMRRPTTGEALFLADRIRRSVERHEFPVVGALTASFGVAELAPDEEVASVITAADEALYRAKAGGRNRTCASRRMMERMEQIQSGKMDAVNAGG